MKKMLLTAALTLAASFASALPLSLELQGKWESTNSETNIKPKTVNLIKADILTVGDNGHTCTYTGTFVRSGSKSFTSYVRSEDPNVAAVCAITLTYNRSLETLSLSTNGAETCNENCGMRAELSFSQARKTSGGFTLPISFPPLNN